MNQLEEILRALGALPPEERAQLIAEVNSQTQHMKWVPLPGPQLDAYNSEADELFFGGSAGGSKSDLTIGLALNCHRRSLILREFRDDARALGERLLQVVGSSAGWNATACRWRTDDQIIEFDGLPNEKDKERHKGRPYDLYAFDEVVDFTESQYEFIIAWNRSAVVGQRCRVLATGNPPTRSKGLWVIKRWAPWLDVTHPRPAKDGELRWYLRNIDGQEVEVEDKGPHSVGGIMTLAKSRSFIRSSLKDNPYLSRTNYDATLARLPPELSAAYREGNFDASLRDHPFQVVPTAWIQAAMARWTPKPPEGIPMCAIGVDCAQGGSDNTVLAPRYDAWFATLVCVSGKDTPLGSDIAGLVVSKRRDDADIVLDMGGGYGGGCFQTLRENGIEVIAYKGANASMKRTKEGKLGFYNKRAEAYWKFREALDPDQMGGSPLALPPDQELLGDLTALTYEVGSRGIQVLEKAEVCKVLGRSPDKADAVVMSFSSGSSMATHSTQWKAEQKFNRRHVPKVDLGPRRRH